MDRVSSGTTGLDGLIDNPSGLSWTSVSRVAYNLIHEMSEVVAAFEGRSRSILRFDASGAHVQKEAGTS